MNSHVFSNASVTGHPSPSSRWRDWRLPLHPSSRPCNRRPLQACPTTSSSSEPAAGWSPWRRSPRWCEGTPLVRDDSSTLRELWGVLAFVMAAGSFLPRDNHRVVMENSGCVSSRAAWCPRSPWAASGSESSSQADHLTLRCRPWRWPSSTHRSREASCSNSSRCRAS